MASIQLPRLRVDRLHYRPFALDCTWAAGVGSSLTTLPPFPPLGVLHPSEVMPMPRTLVRPVFLLLCLLPLLLFLSACTTTQRYNVGALTLCAVGIAGDVAAIVTNTPAIHAVGFFGLVGCGATEIPMRPEAEEPSQPQPVAAESSR